MARTLLVDDDHVELVVTALRDTASLRQRTATRAAGELARAKAAGTIKDDRPGAVRVARFLADADVLATVADQLDRAPSRVLRNAVVTRDEVETDRADQRAALDEDEPRLRVVEELTADALAEAVASAHDDGTIPAELDVREEDLDDVAAALPELAGADA